MASKAPVLMMSSLRTMLRDIKKKIMVSSHEADTKNCSCQTASPYL